MTVSEKQLRVLRANNEGVHTETRECIKTALIDLLDSKQYKAISMTDIINKSGVSRSGVYKNYKNKDEIMFDIFEEPILEVINSLGDSIFKNMEIIFKTGAKHEKEYKTLVDAGLEHNILDLMNKHYENVNTSFYIPLWNGMIYNAFFEWVRVGMPGPVETTITKVKEAMKMVAVSIETDSINRTQNKRL